MNANRKSFAQAASQLSHDDCNEVVVYDPETGMFSLSNRTTANQIGETIVMNGDTGYDPNGSTEQDFYNFFMSKSFDWNKIEWTIEALATETAEWDALTS